MDNSESCTVDRGPPALSKAPALSVVAPCYNEEQTINEFHRRVTRAIRSCQIETYEILLIDDGSRDSTWQVICECVDLDFHVTGVRLSRNHGHQLALTAGLQLCTGDWILILDADLQDPPEVLGKMIERLDAGVDVVYGQRRERVGESLFKRATAKLFYRLIRRLVDVEIPTDTGDFRLMSRRALDVLNSMPEQFRFVRGMVSWIGLRQEPVFYDRQARVAGDTKYPFSKMLRLAIDAITSFSVVPLRAASVVGIVLGATGMPLMLYVLCGWLLGAVVSGWTSLTAIVLVMGSVQLIVLGIMGEYLGRLYIETKRRPLYVIDTLYGANMDGAEPFFGVRTPCKSGAVPHSADKPTHTLRIPGSRRDAVTTRSATAKSEGSNIVGRNQDAERRPIP